MGNTGSPYDGCWSKETVHGHDIVPNPAEQSSMTKEDCIRHCIEEIKCEAVVWNASSKCFLKSSYLKLAKNPDAGSLLLDLNCVLSHDPELQQRRKHRLQQGGSPLLNRMGFVGIDEEVMGGTVAPVNLTGSTVEPLSGSNLTVENSTTSTPNPSVLPGATMATMVQNTIANSTNKMPHRTDYSEASHDEGTGDMESSGDNINDYEGNDTGSGNDYTDLDDGVTNRNKEADHVTDVTDASDSSYF